MSPSDIFSIRTFTRTKSGGGVGTDESKLSAKAQSFLENLRKKYGDYDFVVSNDGICYSWRLSEAARFAAENNFELFTSTLFYSRHQNHELMKKIAEHFADVFGVKFFYEDFRDGWQAGIDLSLQLGLYRQNYCGCIFSEEERFSNDLRKARKKYFSDG